MMKFKSFILLALVLFVCSVLAVENEIKGDESKEINQGRGGGRYCRRQYCCGGWGRYGCNRYCCTSSGVSENEVEPENHWGGGGGGHGGGGKGGRGGGKGGGGGGHGVDETEINN